MKLAPISLTLSTISLLEVAINSTDALVGAAERPARFGFRGPTVDVEVRPSLGLLDEALEEQRSRDRAGESAGTGIVHSGDLRRDHRVVGSPERHVPERVVGHRTGRHE